MKRPTWQEVIACAGLGALANLMHPQATTIAQLAIVIIVGVVYLVLFVRIVRYALWKIRQDDSL